MFGETIPLVELFPSIRKLFPRSGVFTRGTRLESLKLNGTKFLPTVCYEDILPSLTRRIYQRGGPPHAMVNVTNDSWYGDTQEPWIHLVLATFRSIETRRSLIRSTNTGISAIVDPLGRIQKRTGQWSRETLVDDVVLMESPKTTVYMWAGDYLGWLSLLVLAAFGFRFFYGGRLRRAQSTAPEIDVERSPANKAVETHSVFSRQIDGKAGGGGHGDYGLNSGDQRLLNDLKTGASRDGKEQVGCRYLVSGDQETDALVDCVVPSHILAGDHELACFIEHPRRVQSTGDRKGFLGLAQGRG